MALFQKKPDVSSSAPLYTLGLEKTFLVVGLGNAGKEYASTRHNTGFLCVDEFVAKQDDFSGWTTKKDLKSTESSGIVSGNRIIVIKPTTMMNNSGEAVRAVSDFYKIPAANIVVIYDELDIAFGSIRTGLGGNSAGHNGINSIIQHMGLDFNRIRVGIGSEHPARSVAASFVLSDFSKEEMEQLPNLKKEVLAILSEFLHAAGPIVSETRRFVV